MITSKPYIDNRLWLARPGPTGKSEQKSQNVKSIFNYNRLNLLFAYFLWKTIPSPSFPHPPVNQSFSSFCLVLATSGFVMLSCLCVKGPPGLPGLKGDPGSKGEKVSHSLISSLSPSADCISQVPKSTFNLQRQENKRIKSIVNTSAVSLFCVKIGMKKKSPNPG